MSKSCCKPCKRIVIKSVARCQQTCCNLLVFSCVADVSVRTGPGTSERILASTALASADAFFCCFHRCCSPFRKADTGGFRRKLKHMEMFGSQLHVYCHFMICGSEQILLNCIYLHYIAKNTWSIDVVNST